MEMQNLAKDEEAIKLCKNTKGYNWEIKILGRVDETQLKRLKELNEAMRDDYGSDELI